MIVVFFSIWTEILDGAIIRKCDGRLVQYIFNRWRFIQLDVQINFGG